MSYYIRVVRDADGLRLDMPAAARAAVPDGTYVINGHQVPAGASGMNSLSVAAGGLQAVAGAAVDRSTPVTTPAT